MRNRFDLLCRSKCVKIEEKDRERSLLAAVGTVISGRFIP